MRSSHAPPRCCGEHPSAAGAGAGALEMTGLGAETESSEGMRVTKIDEAGDYQDLLMFLVIKCDQDLFVEFHGCLLWSLIVQISLLVFKTSLMFIPRAAIHCLFSPGEASPRLPQWIELGEATQGGVGRCHATRHAGRCLPESRARQGGMQAG